MVSKIAKGCWKPLSSAKWRPFVQGRWVNFSITTYILLRKYRFNTLSTLMFHDDVIKWKHCLRYWSFVRGIRRSSVNSPHKGQWHGALMFSLICVWINGCVNNRKAGDLRRYCAHYDVIVMWQVSPHLICDDTCRIKTWCITDKSSIFDAAINGEKIWIFLNAYGKVKF